MAQTIQYDVVTDIALDVNGDWLIGPSPTGLDMQMTGDAPGLAQRVNIALQFFLGEWFLDQSVGVPWWQDVFIKNPNPATLQTIFRTAILMVQGITAVTELTISAIDSARNVQIFWKATGDLGQLVSGTVVQPI